MRKIVLYEVCKGVAAFGMCFLFFTLLPLSLFVLLLPFEIIVYLFIRKKVSIGGWIQITLIVYVAVFFLAFLWITTGHEGLEFLLDIDVWRRMV